VTGPKHPTTPNPGVTDPGMTKPGRSTALAPGVTGPDHPAPPGLGYRALVLAYPPGRRRGELSGTLAEGGRRRPGLREAANLLRHGLRARLGRPRSRGVVVLAFLIALVTGFGGAAAAARVVWEFVPDYPNGTALTEIAETVYPGLSPSGYRPPGGLFFDVSERSTGAVFLTGHDEDFAFATVELSPDGGFVAGDYAAWTEQARDRLVAAGWQVSDIAPTGATVIATGKLDESGSTFSATRDGLSLTVDTTLDVVGTPDGSFWTTATLDRLAPGYVTGAGFGGLLVAGLAGWLGAGWVSRRTEGAGPVVRSLTREPAVIALVLLLPQSLLGLLLLGLEPFADSPPVGPFWSLALTWGFGCTALGVLLLGLAVVVARFAGRPTPDTVVEA
jgi:hypothetical protein